MALLDDTKLAMRITASVYDDEISRLLNAGAMDIGIVDVDATDVSDPLIKEYLITYTRLNFGTPDDYDRLKASLDEQKAQLISNRRYGLRGWLNYGQGNCNNIH